MSGISRRCAAFAVAAAWGACATAADLELVNRTTLVAAIDSNGDSMAPRSASADGRYAVFSSRASNLVSGDSNNQPDLFLHDAVAQTLERVSIGSGGVQSNGDTGQIGGVSDDGRYVVFDSTATNLVPGGSGGARQIYIRDRSSGTTSLLSQVGGAPANRDSANPRLTGDGRYVIFDSWAAFDPTDGNFARDIYRLDRNTGTFELISVSSSGSGSNGDSYEPQISADGSSVLFYTWANNLVSGDTNGLWDLLLRKPGAGTTQRVSVTSSGTGYDAYPIAARQALSGDGRYALFNVYRPGEPGDTNDVEDGYLYDSSNGSVQRVTLGAGGTQLSGHTSAIALSHDGRTLLMQSSDPALGSNPYNTYRHFLRDLSSGAISAVEFRAGGRQDRDETEEGLLSGDGSVVYASSRIDYFVDNDSNDLRDVLRQRVGSAAGERLSLPHAGSAGAYANNHSGGSFQGMGISGDGRYVVFGSDASNLVVGDFNGVTDVFLRDRLLGMTQRISLRPGGLEASCRSFAPQISRDGRYVVFESCATLTSGAFGGYEVFHYDRHTAQLQLVSQTPQGFGAGALSGRARISDDGRYVAFSSSSGSLANDGGNGYTDTFVRDTQAGSTVLASRRPGGGGGNWDAWPSAITGDGRYVLFNSLASDLVAGDTNDAFDAFVFDRQLQTVERVSLGNSGLEPDGHSYAFGLSSDGRHVAFSSWGQNLTGLGSPYFEGAFVRDRATATTELVSRGSDGKVLNGSNSGASISDDGNRVVFFSGASNSGAADSYVHPYRFLLFERDRKRLSPIVAFGEYEMTTGEVVLSGDGDHLVFSTGKVGLVAEDGNNQFRDVFLARRLVDYLFADGYETPTP